MHMKTLLKLCAEKKNGMLEAEVKKLTQQLPEVPTVMKKGFIDWQIMKEAVAPENVVKREVQSRKRKLEKSKRSHNQTSLTRNAEAADPEIQLASAQKKHWMVNVIETEPKRVCSNCAANSSGTRRRCSVWKTIFEC